MENDDALIGTLWSRRQALRMGFGAFIGGSWVALTPSMAANALGIHSSATAPATSSQALFASPALTEGPFFVDEKMNRSNLLTDTTRPGVIHGTPLRLNLNVLCLDASGHPAPYSGAQIDVWHCDTQGVYSDKDNPMNAEVTSGQRWLRGYQIIDAMGAATFSTILPGWYDGRTPHIHFKIRQFSATKKQTAEFTSQFFFDDKQLEKLYGTPPYNLRGKRDMLNTDDGIFSERLKDGSSAGAHQTLDLSADASGYQSHFTIVLTDASLHDLSHDHDGPPGGGPPPNDPFRRPMPWWAM